MPVATYHLSYTCSLIIHVTITSLSEVLQWIYDFSASVLNLSPSNFTLFLSFQNMQTLDHFLLIPSAHCRLLEMGLEFCIWCKMCGCPEMCVGKKLPLLVNTPTEWSSGLNVVISSQQDFFENGSSIENELLEAGPLHGFSRLVNIFVMVWLRS